MAGKYSWIALFVTLQISVVLCRSTEKPNDEVKTVHAGPILFPHGQAAVVKSIDQYFADNMGEPTPESPVPSKMSYDVYIDENTYVSYRRGMDAAAIAGLIMGIFCLLSLMLGCILVCCCKKDTRRPGRIISSGTGGQTTGVQEAGITATAAPGAIQPMQQYPPPYGQAQQQNMYPSVHPSN